MLCFCLFYSQHSCTLPATGRSWCPRSIQVMCISSDTLSGAPFPAVGRVASYTAGCSLQITEPDLSAVWTLSVFRLRDGLPYQVWYHSCFGSTYKLPQSLAKHFWSYCCIQMSFQGYIITVSVLGSLLWVICQCRLPKLQLLGSLQTDDCLSFCVLALASCQIMLFSNSSSSHSKKQRNVSQSNSELGPFLWKKELMKCSVSSCWKAQQGRLELSRKECGQCTPLLMLPIASLAVWMWIGASLAFILGDSQPLVAPQYRNIVVPLRNLSKGAVRPLCPWLGSKGGVQSFVCLLTALISITVIECTLKECVCLQSPWLIQIKMLCLSHYSRKNSRN